jgi:hypothetical protein
VPTPKNKWQALNMDDEEEEEEEEKLEEEPETEPVVTKNPAKEKVADIVPSSEEKKLVKEGKYLILKIVRLKY